MAKLCKLRSAGRRVSDRFAAVLICAAAAVAAPALAGGGETQWFTMKTDTGAQIGRASCRERVCWIV